MQASYGDPVLLSGSAPSFAGAAFTGVKIVNKRGEQTFARQLTIRCDDGTNDLLVSLNGGTSSITVKRTDLQGVTFVGPIHEFAVKAAAGASSAWSAIASVA